VPRARRPAAAALSRLYDKHGLEVTFSILDRRRDDARRAARHDATRATGAARATGAGRAFVALAAARRRGGARDRRRDARGRVE